MAKLIVIIIPKANTNTYSPLSLSLNHPKAEVNTTPPSDSLETSKKYEASFSLLRLFFVLISSFVFALS